MSAQRVAELIQSVRQGLPISEVDDLLQSGRLSATELDRLALPRKTLAHRRAIGRLSPEQSDRLLRIVRVIGEAERVFSTPTRPANGCADRQQRSAAKRRSNCSTPILGRVRSRRSWAGSRMASRLDRRLAAMPLGPRGPIGRRGQDLRRALE